MPRRSRGAAERSNLPSGHIAIGKVVGVFGVRGMIKVNPLTNIRSRFQPGSRIYIAAESHKILGINEHKEQVRLKLAGVDSVEQA
ncbi:MAG: hypothetical protein ACOCX1_05005, partial [Fimbriimonadaceae bacterium]